MDYLANQLPVLHDDGTLEAQVHLRLATCNVLSLCGAKDDHECGLAGPARQQMLLDQLAEERITIFALQETRLRRLHRAHSDDFLLFRSAATDRGHYGLLIGLSKKLTFATTISNGRTIHHKFSEDHVSIILETPRILILRITTKIVNFLIVAGHAPHTGSTQEEISHWWDSISSAIPKTYAVWPMVLLVDANATVGHHPSDAIGDHHAGPHEAKAESFINFVHNQRLWLPSTFEECQRGPSETWFHSGGKSRRIDYVGLPQLWSADHCEAWTSTIIDPAITKTDHLATCVDLRFRWQCGTFSTCKRRRMSSIDHIKDLDLNRLLQAPFISPGIDVHTHADQLQTTLLQCLRPQRQSAGPRPQKQTMTKETWQLVLQKREARRHLADLNHRQRLDVLDFVFSAWRQRMPPLPDFYDHYNKLFSMQDLLIAKALSQFRHLGRLVVAALRHDDSIFFQNLLAEGADLLEPADVKRFWAVIRRSLPRFRQRRAHPPPARIEALEGQIVPYFCELELEDVTEEQALIQHCHQRQLATMARLPDGVTPACQLPSLTAFETSLRTTTPNRATGLDLVPAGVHHVHAPLIARFYYSLLLKMHLWCAEPIQFKGGIMCMIHKKGSLTEAGNYRGILLLASIAKRIHSLTRTTLMNSLGPHRAEGQLGGFCNQMVQFGFHTVCTWTRILSSHGYSTAVLYLDLKSAFHHMIREFALGISSPDDFDHILADLRAAGHPLDAALQGHRLTGALESMGCDPRVIQLLRDIHTDTWFTISQAELVRTKRGTRPGSPLADAIFHVVMAQLMTEVRHWIHTQQIFLDLLKTLDLPVLTVVWADDVAIPWTSSTPTDLVPQICALVQNVERIFSQKGFTINFGLQKTNAVLSFQGPCAPDLRRQYLHTTRPGVDCPLASGSTVWLHFRPVYKHLGYTYAASQTLDVELRTRIGQAHQAMATLGRPILTNRHLPTHVRLRLFNALIGTKLFFGLGTWRTPTLKQMQTLRSFFIACLRKVLRVGKDFHVSNARILAIAGTADVRAFLALDRLRYARKVFTVGPDFLQHLLHCEGTHVADSWLHGLAADLRWLSQLIPDCVPFGEAWDFTKIIDFWQDPRLAWPRLLKRAWTIYLRQEHMMTDLIELSDHFYDVLHQAGAEFDPELSQLFDQPREEIHHCRCGRSFATAQGLALHRVRAHQQFAPEHNLICGATCPHCLRFFWSSARLQQHLAYMPRDGGVNVCFQALTARGYTTEYANVSIPRQIHGAVRLDALQAQGPVGLFTEAAEIEIALTQKLINQLEEELIVKVQPEDHLEAGQLLADKLTECTHIWIRRFRGGHEAPAHAPDLGDWWMRLLFTFDPQFEEWTELVFLSWGSTILPEILANTLDGEIEYTIDQIYYDIYSVLPRTGCQTKLEQARLRLQRLQCEHRTAPQPHRPIRTGTANARERLATVQTIPSRFFSHGDWLRQLRSMRWRTLPREVPTPLFRIIGGQRHFLFVHLFAGRRREGDFHACVAAWAAQRNVLVTILSQDTANSVSLGNLQLRSASWEELLNCYKRGLVTASLAGSPCETFSEARHQQSPEVFPDGLPRRLPRPLRSMERLLGLDGLSKRELEQLHMGSSFFLQGAVLLAYQVLIGGYFISEHPAPPSDSSRASIWTSPWLTLLRGHPDVCLHTVGQWKWGALAPKPTGLLTLRLPYFLRSLHSLARDDLRKPTYTAIGLNPDGSFRTSCLKEYPPLFSAALAKSVTDQLEYELRWGRICSTPSECPASLYSWILEAEEACSTIRSNGWLPDYQPNVR